jgi:hypothetical protein
MNDLNHGLSYLCGAYLHQDYMSDGTWDEVVRLFAKESGTSVLKDTIGDIDAMLASHRSDDEQWRILKRTTGLAIDLRGEGWTMKKWLGWIRSTVLAEIEGRESQRRLPVRRLPLKTATKDDVRTDKGDAAKGRRLFR